MLKSRFPQIIAELPVLMDMVARGAAELVEQRAKERVPVGTGRLRDAIHTERQDLGEYAVIAGDRKAFYGHIVEHGGVHTPAQPFLVPAADDVRPEVQAIGVAALRRLM